MLLVLERLNQLINCGGDGKTAIVAIRRRCSFVGVCFTEEHKQSLYQRLESVVFTDMQTPDSVLFEPGLLAVLGKKGKRKAMLFCLGPESEDLLGN